MSAQIQYEIILVYIFFIPYPHHMATTAPNTQSKKFLPVAPNLPTIPVHLCLLFFTAYPEMDTSSSSSSSERSDHVQTPSALHRQEALEQPWSPLQLAWPPSPEAPSTAASRGGSERPSGRVRLWRGPNLERDWYEEHIYL